VRAPRFDPRHVDLAAFEAWLRDQLQGPAFAAVVALVLENAGGGSAMAAPVARHMLDAYLLPPEPQLPPAPEKPSQPSEVVSQ
jgi:hypothetical protein